MTGEGSVMSASAAVGTVSAALPAKTGAPSVGMTVKLLWHFGQLALAPTAVAGARTPPARQ
jgi:hypothetical protein